MNAKILLVFFLGSLLAISQESMDELSLSALMDIQVTTVSKKAEKISQAPSNISVVTARQIKEWGVRDIKDLLKRMTGWPVIPDRDEWVFAVRGNVSDNNAKYLILLDGHRLNSIENFGPGQIIEMPNNLASVKRVEIIRGPGSAVWGPDALAGVVNIITKDAADIVSQGGDGNQNESQSGSQVAINPGLGFDDLSDGTTTLHNGGTFDFQTARLSGDAEVVFFASGGYSEGETVSQAKSAGFAAATDRKMAIAGGLPSDSATYPGYYETLLEKHRPGFMLQSKAKLGGLSINALSFSTETFNRHYESPLGRENYLTTYKGFVEGSYVVQPNSDQMLTFKLSTGINRAEYQPFADPTNLTNMVNIVWLDRQLMAGVDYNVSLYDNLNIGAGLDYTLTKTGPNQRLNKFNINITADSASKSANSVGYWFDPLLEDQQIGGYLQGKYSPIEKVNLVLGGRFDYNDDRGSDPTNINPRAAVIVTPSSSTAIKLLYNRGY